MGINEQAIKQGISDFQEKFQEKFNGAQAELGQAFKRYRAPGRVNLIGGHTDYNGGFVLPVAINRETLAIARLRQDNKVRVYSSSFKEGFVFKLDEIEYNEEQKWVNYVQGIAEYLQLEGFQISGLDLVIISNVPQGAGLSSSASLEVAVACAWRDIDKLDLGDVNLAKLCQKAENNFVGVNCGIMDQFISVLGKQDHALFLDCKSEEYELVPFGGDKVSTHEDGVNLKEPKLEKRVKIVVADSNVRHNLADSEYNKRREECQRGVEYFNRLLDKQVQALRDVSIDDFNSVGDRLPEPIRSRCQHVIQENIRVQKCKRALEQGSFAEVGRLITESHHSLKNLYEVSSKELDLLVDLAQKVEGVFGARMTGAGFGGSTVNLVVADAVDDFKQMVKEEYYKAIGEEVDVYVCEVESGCNKKKR